MPQYSGMWTLSQVSQAVKNQTWTGLPPSVVEYLIVAGGGGAGGGAGSGGGGAGGLLAGYVGITAGASYFVTVGAGGSGSNANGVKGITGNNSVFDAASSGATTGRIVASGGGGSGAYSSSGAATGVMNALFGGSGGGGGSYGNQVGGVGNAGISGQGNDGGDGSSTVNKGGGGGGGAGSAGLAGTSTVGGTGGSGIASSISGTVTSYAGGGAGGSRESSAASGGVGGGGNGGTSAALGVAGSSNTGGGGGGAGDFNDPSVGLSGGSGVVIIRYPGTTQFFTGGTLSYGNGHVIHTFYANGVLAPIAGTLYANPDYQIARSLRFNSADTTYLGRTPATATNRRTFTWSGWVKRSVIGSGTQSIFTAFWASNDGGYFNVLFRAGDDLAIQTWSIDARITTQLFRDPSAWYHIVVAVDTTQTLNIDRVKLYVNGAQVTSFATTGTIAQNTELAVNYNGTHYIGSLSTTQAILNGYQTECYLIDGQQLTPSSFGWTNPATGVWAPIKYVGTYGTNGFYLNFSDNSNVTAATLGADTSGNGNNWTPNNFSVTAGAGNDSLVDSPTPYGTDTGVGGEVRGNYSTMNSVNKGSTVTLSNGNLDQVTASGGWNSARASIAVASGKWYWEVTITGTSQLVMHGVDDNTYNVTTNPSSAYVGAYTNSWGVYASNGQKRNNTGSGTAYGSAFAQNDVMMVAMDMDSGKIWWGKNGTWFASGDPVAGTNAGYTNLSGYTLNPATSCFDTTDSCTHNFGQRPFAYTAPSGFKALCTQNLPTPTIGATAETLAGKYFNTVLYNGNSSTQQVAVGFQPDWVWIKSRSTSGSPHALFDVLRGVSKMLQTDQSNAEYEPGSGDLTSFDSSGFGLTHNPNSNITNTTGRTYVAWNWKAGGTGVTNTSGSITSTVSANPTTGFSIVTYTGTGTAATIGHGLGTALSQVTVKQRNGVNNWPTWNTGLTGGNGYYVYWDSTNGVGTASNVFNGTNPTSSVFSVGTNSLTNGSTNTYVAYCFAPVAGFSAFGNYTGNGSVDGPFVYTGFKPRFVMIKDATNASTQWHMIDSTRNPFNVADLRLITNLSNAESQQNLVDFTSNGFKLRDPNLVINTSAANLIYMAFAENPFKYSLAR